MVIASILGNLSSLFISIVFVNRPLMCGDRFNVDHSKVLPEGRRKPRENHITGKLQICRCEFGAAERHASRVRFSWSLGPSPNLYVCVVCARFAGLVSST